MVFESDFWICADVNLVGAGLSLQVEAVLRGRGYLETFLLNPAIIIYDNLSELQKR